MCNAVYYVYIIHKSMCDSKSVITKAFKLLCILVGSLKYANAHATPTYTVWKIFNHWHLHVSVDKC